MLSWTRGLSKQQPALQATLPPFKQRFYLVIERLLEMVWRKDEAPGPWDPGRFGTESREEARVGASACRGAALAPASSPTPRAAGASSGIPAEAAWWGPRGEHV